jgi:hypothetical protein
MRDPRKEVDRGATLGCGAIEWFVENESDRAAEEAVVLNWEDWFGDPANEAEYISVVEMCLQIRRLPPPSIVSREDLLRDARAELGAVS